MYRQCEGGDAQEAGAAGISGSEHQYLRRIRYGNQLVAGSGQQRHQRHQVGGKQEYPEGKGDNQDQLPHTAQATERVRKERACRGCPMMADAAGS